MAAQNFFGLTALDSTRKVLNFSKYQGKVMLVVNVASECGYTESNYQELEPLYRRHSGKGFEVLAFPCNQFGEQEPGTIEQICKFVTNYGVTFPILDKVEVNGPNTHPVYKYLKSTFPDDIGWNFHKFLVDSQGIPVKSYDPDVATSDIEADIIALLDKNGGLWQDEDEKEDKDVGEKEEEDEGEDGDGDEGEDEEEEQEEGAQ